MTQVVIAMWHQALEEVQANKRHKVGKVLSLQDRKLLKEEEEV